MPLSLPPLAPHTHCLLPTVRPPACFQLEGKRYASYAARYEGRIVQSLIKNDGGSGEYQELVLPMLGLWNTLLQVGWKGLVMPLAGEDLAGDP